MTHPQRRRGRVVLRRVQKVGSSISALAEMLPFSRSLVTRVLHGSYPGPFRTVEAVLAAAESAVERIEAGAIGDWAHALVQDGFTDDELVEAVAVDLDFAKARVAQVLNRLAQPG